MATTNKKLDPTNENLVLPDYNEKADINVINSNFTKAADAINTLNSKRTLKSVDVSATANPFQVNNTSGGVVSVGNFVSGFVVGTNAVIPLFYTYAGYVYGCLYNQSGLTPYTVGSGGITVRLFYTV